MIYSLVEYQGQRVRSTTRGLVRVGTKPKGSLHEWSLNNKFLVPGAVKVDGLVTHLTLAEVGKANG